MSFLKKIFKGIGKVAKVALPLAAGFFAPQITGAIGGLFGKSSSSGAAMGTPQADGSVVMPQTTVSPPTDWSKWAGAVGSVASGAMNYYGQREANFANAQQAQQQMDFQRSMSDTSYQRGTADMKSAGLNPMLAYSQGGASAPGGATAQMGNEAGAAANSALSAASTLQSLENAKATSDLTRAQTASTLEGIAKIQADTDTSLASAGQLRAATDRQLAEITGINVENEWRKGTVDARIRQSKADATTKELGIPEASAMAGMWRSAYGRNIAPYANSAGGIVRSLSPFSRFIK